MKEFILRAVISLRSLRSSLRFQVVADCTHKTRLQAMYIKQAMNKQIIAGGFHQDKHL